MTSIKGFFYDLFINSNLLLKTNIDYKDKLIIIIDFFRITLKSLFFNPNSEKVLGLTFNFFNYKTFRFLFSEIFFRNEYFFVSSKKDPVIVDCGANIGMASIYFKYLYPKSKIFSFEPDIKTFDLLKKNIEINDFSDIKIFNCALSSKDGNLPFFIDKSDLGSLRMSTDSRRLSKDKVVVKSRKLSSFFDSEFKGLYVDFIKMDIEGSEVEVLNDLIKNKKLTFIKSGVIEYHHKINNKKSALGNFLFSLESAGFEYQISASNVPVCSSDKFQDILIYFYR